MKAEPNYVKTQVGVSITMNLEEAERVQRWLETLSYLGDRGHIATALHAALVEAR